MPALADKLAQRPLDFPGPFQPQLDNFIPGNNGAVVQLLQQQCRQPDGWHYLHGAAACGKTHLLWSVQAAALRRGLQALYVQISAAQQLELLSQMRQQDLLLLDNADALSLHEHWQQALFDTLQRAQLQQLTVIMAGRNALPGMVDLLPDLRSRLAAMSQHRVQPLPDSDRAEFVQAYLTRHGIPIDKDMLDYLLNRTVRAQAHLLVVLQRLCQQVLVSGQRPTRPMLRELLSSSDQVKRRK